MSPEEGSPDGGNPDIADLDPQEVRQTATAFSLNLSTLIGAFHQQRERIIELMDAQERQTRALSAILDLAMTAAGTRLALEIKLLAQSGLDLRNPHP
jgi:hypothetical protein